MPSEIELCGIDGCRRIKEHSGKHDKYPTEAWAFLREVDQNKLDKAGYATPRGGAKGAYQNHVLRNSQVIIPFERLKEVDLNKYKEGYVVRLYPEQYFATRGVPRPGFLEEDSLVQVGRNAFVLYRSYESLDNYPPLEDWDIRYLAREKNGEWVTVADRRGVVRDEGHYVYRLSKLGARPKQEDGPPQGIFAPEYAEREINYQCQCVLAWLTVHTLGSPYTSSQAAHLKAILAAAGLVHDEHYEYKGVMGHGLTKCPLCMRFIRYEELHATVSFAEEAGLENAAEQVAGSTRSTIVNLFHLTPLIYNELRHVPENIAWGHAICNTRLGQRRSYSLAELIGMELKVGVIRPEGIETFGWISEDFQMIRSPGGAVWIQLHGDIGEVSPPSEEGTLESTLESEVILLGGEGVIVEVEVQMDGDEETAAEGSADPPHA